MKHYAPNSVNITMTIIQDVQSFKKRSYESLEEAFTRWDIITERAAQANVPLTESPEMISYKWLQQFHIPQEHLPQLLQQFEHKLPRSQEDLIRFRQAIISLNRLLKRGSSYSIWPEPGQPQAATHFADAPTHAYMTFPSAWEPPNMEATLPWLSSEPWSGHWDSASTSVYHGTTCACETCRNPEAYAFYEEPCYDTDTETDDGEEDQTFTYWLDAAAKQSGAMDHLTAHVLDTYALYKKRWRRLTGRSTRRQRFSRRPKGKGKGKSRAFLCRTCSSQCDWQSEGPDYAFAAGNFRRKKDLEEKEKEKTG